MITLNSMPLYDPRLSALLATVKDEWGSEAQRKVNRENMISYGVPHIDKALFGIQFGSGELLAVQGAKKMRKTTFMANVILHAASQLRAKGKPWWIAIDTLESGLSPKEYRNMLIAIVATWKMVATKYGDDRLRWPAEGKIRRAFGGGSEESPNGQLVIAKRWLQHARFTKEQLSAIDAALASMDSLPIMIFGPSPREGNARLIEDTVLRWERLYHGDFPTAKGCPVRMFVSDNIPQYRVKGSDYDIQRTIVDAVSLFITSHPHTVGFVAAQMGVGSLTREIQGIGQAYARGGLRLSEEVNTIFRTKYDEDKTPYFMTIQTDDSRDARIPRLIQEINDSSGAFLGAAVPVKEYQDRPGWER